MLCIALQYRCAWSPLQCKWTRQVSFAIGHRTYVCTSHSHRNIADSTQSLLCQRYKTMRRSQQRRQERTELHPTSLSFYCCFLSTKCHVSFSQESERYIGHTHTQLTTPPVALQHRRCRLIAFGACRPFYHEKVLVHLTILTIFLVVVNNLSRLLLLAIFFTCRWILAAHQTARSQLGGPQGGAQRGRSQLKGGGGGGKGEWEGS